MTDAVVQPSASIHTGDAAVRRLRRRYAAERRFKLYGLAAVLVAVASLLLLLWSVFSTGYTAFFATQIRLEVLVDPELLESPTARDRDSLGRGDYMNMLRRALQEQFPEVASREQRRRLNGMLSIGAGDLLRAEVLANPSLIGRKLTLWVPAASDFDMLKKGVIDRRLSESQRRVNDEQVAWFEKLEKQGQVESRFNRLFFTRGDSREPELAGVWAGVVGSIYTLGITLLLAFPLGVATAIYLEEFAPRNRWTDFIEVNINNLAAVPSIVFGLLGLAVFLQFFGLPRSAPVVGGIVLALMSLPVIIIAGRASLRAVPPSIRQAAIGLGASPVQVVVHHVLPLAMPGILTGTILAMAHALGETAPLLMIGMVAFIVDVPTGPLSAASVLPVQVYMWAESAERGFTEKSSAAIVVLLVFLLLMNAAAILLRRKFERRW